MLIDVLNGKLLAGLQRQWTHTIEIIIKMDRHLEFNKKIGGTNKCKHERQRFSLGMLA